MVWDYDKLTMTKIFAKEVLQMDLKNNKQKAIFCGDSPNDQPMFEFFPISIGVRNIESFLPQISSPPQFITKNIGGEGFAEIVDILLKKRK